MYQPDRVALSTVPADAPTAPLNLPPGPPPVASFTDPHGRRWGLTLTPTVLTAFRDECGVDLPTAIQAGQAPAALADRPESLVELLWLACESQARGFGLTPEEFGRTVLVDRDPATPSRPRLRTDVYEAATVAVFRALGALYPDTPFGRWVQATGGRRKRSRSRAQR